MPHGSLDAFAKDLLRQSGPDLVSWLAGERPLEVQDAPSDLVKAEERRADYVLRAVLPGGRPPHYLHVEVQSEGDPEMNLRMLEYWAWMKRNFRKKEEGPFGVSCFVIYLSRRRFLDDPGGVDEDNRLGTETRFRYRVLKLWEMDPQTVLGLETPALAPLAPLMKGADPAALVIESRRKIVDADEVPDHKKDDLRVALQTFGGLLVKDTQLLERLVWEGSMDLEESSAVQSWMRKGKVEGLKLGVQKGLLEARRGALLAVLSARFGRVGKSIEARILRIKDAVLLEKLIKRAAVVPDQRQFSEEIL